MPSLLTRCTVLVATLTTLASSSVGCAVSAGAEGADPSIHGIGSIQAETVVAAPTRAQLGNLDGTLELTAPRAAILGEDLSCTPSSTVAAGASGWRDMDFTGQEWAFGARYQHTAVWDGREMIVFGGAVGDAPEAAAFEPNRDAWSKLPKSGLYPRVRHHAVWTGHAMIVWGGAGNLEGGDTTLHYDDGALYDPCSLTWRSIPKAPESFREGSSAVWASTTRELVVFGGLDAAGKLTHDGLAYRPATQTWRHIAPAPFAPTGTTHAVWTGAAMITLSTVSGSGGEARIAASYDPTNDAWTTLPGAPATTPRGDTAIASGASLTSATFLFGPTAKTTFDGTYDGYLDMSGSTWDTQSNAWLTIPAPAKDVLSERTRAMTWWGNGKLYVWGGHVMKDADPYVHTASDGASFDPQTGVWTHLPKAPVYAMREGATVVWTGTEAIFTGGAASCTMCNPMPTGGEIFRP